MFGFVEKFVDIRPKRVRLYGVLGDPLRTTVSITPGQKYPFKIVDARARNGKYIKFDLEELKNSSVSKYILTIENTRQTAGRYTDVIYLKTDSTIRPSISVYVMGHIVAPKQSKKKQ